MHTHPHTHSLKRNLLIFNYLLSNCRIYLKEKKKSNKFSGKRFFQQFKLKKFITTSKT